MTRIGMIVPSSNTCLEPVTARILTTEPDVSVHVARVPVTRITLDADASDQFGEQKMLDAAGLLADALVDVIVWNGTSGSWLGIDRDRRLAEAIEMRTGIPATTSTLALHAAFAAFGARRIALVTPYTDDVAAQIVVQYEAHGLTIVAGEHLGITDNESFARVPPAAISDRVRAAAASGADAIAVVCTNLFGADVVAELEHELGIPIMDSVSTTLWHALEGAGAPRSVPGWGSVLASGWLRAAFQRTCDELLAATGADRVTVRIDLPDLGMDVDRAVAEAVTTGVARIRFDDSIAQRQAATIAWLDEHRSNLVQSDLRDAPAPPAALVETYGVRAQLLGPVVDDGQLAGWLSVHSRRERAWSSADIAAMDAARAQVTALLWKGTGLT